MSYAFDEDTSQELHAEERAYNAWVKEKKSYLFTFQDTKKKQQVWNELFPKLPESNLIF